MKITIHFHFHLMMAPRELLLNMQCRFAWQILIRLWQFLNDIIDLVDYMMIYRKVHSRT